MGYVISRVGSSIFGCGTADILIISEYKEVPTDLKDDNVIPYVSEIPSLWTSMRHPRKSRSVSMGPQSQADAYETLAYREKRRRESLSEVALVRPKLVEERDNQGKRYHFMS